MSCSRALQQHINLVVIGVTRGIPPSRESYRLAEVDRGCCFVYCSVIFPRRSCFHTSGTRGTRTALWLESHAGEAGDKSDQSHCSSRASHPNSQRPTGGFNSCHLLVTCCDVFRSIKSLHCWIQNRMCCIWLSSVQPNKMLQWYIIVKNRRILIVIIHQVLNLVQTTTVLGPELFPAQHGKWPEVALYLFLELSQLAWELSY